MWALETINENPHTKTPHTMIITIVVIFLLLAFLRRCFRRRAYQLPTGVNRLANRLDDADSRALDRDDEEFVVAECSRPVGRSKAARRAAAHVRSKIGLPKMSEANRLVAGRLIRDFLSDSGVRPSHIVAIEPIALFLVFLPRREDILGKQLEHSMLMVERQAEYNGYWFSLVRSWFWWNKVELDIGK